MYMFNTLLSEWLSCDDTTQVEMISFIELNVFLDMVKEIKAKTLSSKAIEEFVKNIQDPGKITDYIEKCPSIMLLLKPNENNSLEENIYDLGAKFLEKIENEPLLNSVDTHFLVEYQTKIFSIIEKKLLVSQIEQSQPNKSFKL